MKNAGAAASDSSDCGDDCGETVAVPCERRIYMTDPIADMLTRIRNAQAVFLPTVDIPFSRLKYEIAKTLERSGFIEYAEKKGRKEKIIHIVLTYEEDPLGTSKAKKIPLIGGLRRVSKPGQRIYISWRKIRPVKRGYGIAILSTPRGILTDKEARKQKVGGEILCEIW